MTNTSEDTYQHQRDAYRKSLQETSKNRVKNWGNTMEALRYKREEDRIKRLEDEEVSIRDHSRVLSFLKRRVTDS